MSRDSQARWLVPASISEHFRSDPWTYRPGRWQADDAAIPEGGTSHVRHGTARVRGAARRGGSVAGYGTGAAVGAGEADRRIDGDLGKRSRPERDGLDAHTRSRGSWLDGRNEYPYREALGRGQLRSVTDACIGPRTPRSASRAFTSRRTTR